MQAALADIAVPGDAKGETTLDGAGATFPKPLYRNGSRNTTRPIRK